MTSRPEIQCVSCVHWQPPLDRDDKQDMQLCGAFPDGSGIPEEIWWGRVDHRSPHSGDHGVRWESLDGAEFPERAMAASQRSVPKSFESDLAAALALSDPLVRAAALALLAKHLPGKHDQSSHGRGGGAVSAAMAQEALLTQLDITPAHPVRVAAGSVDELMGRMAAGEPVNLERVQVTGKENENMFARHATETPRGEMPQLPTTVAGLSGFMADLDGRGVGFSLSHGVDPRSLHATQNELDGKKVGSMYGAISSGQMSMSGSVIIASREGAVLDGHHRWAAGSAARIAGQDVSITVLTVDMPIVDLLQVAEGHSGARRVMGQKSLATPDRPPPDPDKPYIWVDGGWLLVITDTTDGVPDQLEFAEPSADSGKSLASWEGDVHQALLLADQAVRDSVLEELAKHLPGKHDQSSHGRGGGAAGGGGTVSAQQAYESLLISLDVTPSGPIRIAPDQVDSLMGQMASGQAVNLENLQVTGQGNENLFARHATDTPRSEMPQLPETVEEMGSFRSALATKGVRTQIREVDPRTLHATQNELDGAKVGKLYGFIRGGGYRAESTLIVSREGAVLDGHHRWAGASAARAAGSDFKVRVLAVDMSIDELLPFSQPFSGARRAMGASAATEIVAASAWELDLGLALALADPATRAATLGALAKHLPGKHDQSAHGHGGNVQELFKRAEAGGFTYSVATGEFASTGFAVSPYPERSKVVAWSEATPDMIDKYEQDNADLLAKPGHNLGAWREIDGDTDRLWLDVSIVAQDRGEAARIGRDFDQVSMFDLAAGETVDLGGTGGIKSLGAIGLASTGRGQDPPIRGPTLAVDPRWRS